MQMRSTRAELSANAVILLGMKARGVIGRSWSGILLARSPLRSGTLTLAQVARRRPSRRQVLTAARSRLSRARGSRFMSPGGRRRTSIVPSSSNFDVDFDPGRATLDHRRAFERTRQHRRHRQLWGRRQVSPCWSRRRPATVPAQFTPDACRHRRSAATMRRPSSSRAFPARLTCRRVPLSALSPVAIPTLRPGVDLQLRVPIQIHGNGRFVDAEGNAAVDLRVLELAAVRATRADVQRRSGEPPGRKRWRSVPR